MGTAREIISAWKISKGVGFCFVLSLASGWLTRELFFGNIDPANKAAAYILDLALVVMVLILGILGTVRWRRHELTPTAKRILVISIVFLVVFFIVGWRSDISLK
jgi:hypothetical protein